MSNDLIAVFARIHADYRAAIAMTVHNLPQEALEAVSAAFMAMEADAKKVSFRNISNEAWVAAPRVRIEVRREIKRRREAATQEEQA